MKILATDLDRTLLPNGSWEKDEEAIDLFNKLTIEQGVTVVYVTGRNLDLTSKALKEYGVRPPDILCGDVGTTIRAYKDGQWTADPDWDSHVLKTSPRWDGAKIVEVLRNIEGLVEQGAEHQNPFKQSYFIAVDKMETVLPQVHRALGGNYDEVAVDSIDHGANTGLVDILPLSATKQTALEFVAKKFQIPKGEVVFCGDSGNDILPLTAGFSGVLVRNADKQLVGQVKLAMKKNPSLKAYFAVGGFQGLNGYYTSGVIEGAYHYGIFK